MARQLATLAVAVCGLAMSSAAWAQPFHLDPTFGTDGIMIDAATPTRIPFNLLVQPDGKILAGGHRGTADAIGVLRYLANGDPDPAFTAPAFPLDFVYGIALQSDGRILLAGQDDFEIFTVVRLLEGGALDSSFGGDGIVTTTFGGTDTAVAVEVQEDDKIVVVGSSIGLAGPSAVFARYLTDGSPDPGFGSGGTVVVPGVASVPTTTRLILDSQDRFVTSTERQLIRLLPGGGPDGSFGTQGVLELPPNFFCTSIAAAPDDAVLVVGGGAGNVALLRYTSAGVLDAAFGDAGQARFGGTSGQQTSLFRAVGLPDGSSYVTGGSSGAWLLARFLNDGTVDQTFGPGGFLLTRVGSFGLALGLAVQTDGAIVQVGHANGDIYAHTPTLVRSVVCGAPSAPPPTITAVSPDVVSANGHTIVDISGTNLGTVVQVRIGHIDSAIVGIPATGTVQATTPLFAPMGLADVDVITDDCQATTMSDAVFVHPIDVRPGDPYYPFVRRLIVNEVTGGCSQFAFCPDDLVTRGQMAVFLLRSKEGGSYEPPPATGTVFTDVPINAFAAAWIEELSRRGITAGCDVNLYCPIDANTRAQMAVFLLVTLEGTGYQPPVATGIFSDVPVSSVYAPWIEELFERGITAGCGTGLYCPDDPVLREQMAVFLSVTFSLPG